MRRPILLIGLGDVGRHVLELLARLPNVPEVLAVDVNAVDGRKRLNTALAGAALAGLYPRLGFRQLDVSNTDATATLLAETNPRLVFTSLTLQPPAVFEMLPRDLRHRVYPGLGAWLPMHLALSHTFMRAFKASGIDAQVVNASFPDAVNVILSRCGLGPLVGIGNLDCVVPTVRRTVAEVRGVHARRVDVRMVGHHYHSYNIGRYGRFDARAPLVLRITIDGADVTGEFDAVELLARVPAVAGRCTGREGHFATASSAVRTLTGIYNDSNELAHAQGVEDVPGACPVTLTARGARLCLPAGVSRTDAIALMEQAQRFDAIERIEPDGTVLITDEARETVAKAIGYCWSRLEPAQATDVAREMTARFDAWTRSTS